MGTFATRAEAWVAQNDQGAMVVVPNQPDRSLQVWVSKVHASGKQDRIAFLTSREGRFVHGRRAFLWNRDTDRIHEVTLQNPQAPNSEIHAGDLTVSRDGLLLALEGIQPLDEAPFTKNRVGIWSTTASDPVAWLPVDDGGIVSLAISTDSKYLAVLSTPIVPDGSDALQVWDLNSRRKEVYPRSPPGRPQESDGVLNDQVIPLAMSPDNQWIAVGGPAGRVDIWSRTSRTFSKAMNGHRGPVWSLSFNQDGTRLAAGGRDGTTLIWKWLLK
jgi:WD40 repeat protein